MRNNTRLTNFTPPHEALQQGRTYSLSTWRKKILEKDRETCRFCLNTLKDGHILSAHHIIARTHGGKNTLDNGITLCHQCHRFADWMNFTVKKDAITIILSMSVSQRINAVRKFWEGRIHARSWHSDPRMAKV